MPDYPSPYFPFPDDKEFGPRDPNATAQRTADSSAAAAAIAALPGGVVTGDRAATQVQRIAYANAHGQYLANALNCGVKVHWHLIPGAGHTGPSARIDFTANDRTKDPATAAAPV